MNRKISLAAIAMFAVIMGMTAFAPALAEGSNHQKTRLCHFEAAHIDPITLEEIPDEWHAINVNNRSLPAHNEHGDVEITTDDEAFWCVANQDGTVVDPNL